MKNLSNLTGIKVLSKEQQKSIVAGVWQCECTGSVGQWVGNYSNNVGATNAISEWCSSGTGVCSNGIETVGIYLA